MASGWSAVRPGSRTLTAAVATGGIVLGSLVTVAIGLAVLGTSPSVFALVVLTVFAPVVGGTIAGCFSRGNVLVGVFSGASVGCLVVVTLLYCFFVLIADAPATGGAGIAFGILFVLLLVASVIALGGAVVGGPIGTAIRRTFGTHCAEQARN